MILLTVLIATLVIAVCLPVLGQRVLERRIVFVDLALAQVAATGYALGMALEIPGVYAAAATTAIAVIIMALMDEETPLPKEAVMGGVYAFAASVGMVLLSLLPYGEGQLMGLLFGSVLGIGWDGIIELAIFAGMGLLLALPEHANSFAGRMRFYAGLSLIIVPAIYAIGVLLVFAYLVMPALSVWRRGHNGPAWQALTLAVIASTAGTFIADFLDLPPSATVVLTLATIAVITGTIIHFTDRGNNEPVTADDETDTAEEDDDESNSESDTASSKT
ncbi:zinc/manganese transport system permease protein [Mariprofundus micogutta]|uniref:Zinc/manganese transport system permease protein n=1 Tax=Mariprofundus micogutta TaxID=1921010 RepID=A0A1L8CNE7_9PROT|nr:metal ABC transporter permease [Mariprofundus micogutta]GAV20438.1 zinc/manganese transport system permease protein [Mariprofundus micogutta]